jgi:hypothetical protein
MFYSFRCRSILHVPEHPHKTVNRTERSHIIIIIIIIKRSMRDLRRRNTQLVIMRIHTIQRPPHDPSSMTFDVNVMPL